MDNIPETTSALPLLNVYCELGVVQRDYARCPGIRAYDQASHDASAYLAIYKRVCAKSDDGSSLSQQLYPK